MHIDKINRVLRKNSVFKSVLFFLAVAIPVLSNAIFNSFSIEVIIIFVLLLLSAMYLSRKEDRILADYYNSMKLMFTIYEEKKIPSSLKYIWYVLMLISILLVIGLSNFEQINFNYYYPIILINVLYYWQFIFLNNLKINVYENGILRMDIFTEIIPWNDLERIEENITDNCLIITMKDKRSIKISNDQFSLQGNKFLDIKNFIHLNIKHLD